MQNAIQRCVFVLWILRVLQLFNNKILKILVCGQTVAGCGLQRYYINISSALKANIKIYGAYGLSLSLSLSVTFWMELIPPY